MKQQNKTKVCDAASPPFLDGYPGNAKKQCRGRRGCPTEQWDLPPAGTPGYVFCRVDVHVWPLNVQIWQGLISMLCLCNKYGGVTYIRFICAFCSWVRDEQLGLAGREALTAVENAHWNSPDTKVFCHSNHVFLLHRWKCTFNDAIMRHNIVPAYPAMCGNIKQW